MGQRARWMRPRRWRWLLTLAIGLGGCDFTPDIADGQLRCGEDGLCPPAFACAQNGYCYRGAFPPDAALAEGPRPRAWIVSTIGPGVDLMGVWSGPGGVVVVGAEGVILHSADGVSWEPRVSGVTKVLRAVRGGTTDVFAV